MHCINIHLWFKLERSTDTTTNYKQKPNKRHELTFTNTIAITITITITITNTITRTVTFMVTVT